MSQELVTVDRIGFKIDGESFGLILENTGGYGCLGIRSEKERFFRIIESMNFELPDTYANPCRRQNRFIRKFLDLGEEGMNGIDFIDDPPYRKTITAPFGAKLHFERGEPVYPVIPSVAMNLAVIYGLPVRAKRDFFPKKNPDIEMYDLDGMRIYEEESEENPEMPAYLKAKLSGVRVAGKLDLKEEVPLDSSPLSTTYELEGYSIGFTLPVSEKILDSVVKKSSPSERGFARPPRILNEFDLICEILDRRGLHVEEVNFSHTTIDDSKGKSEKAEVVLKGPAGKVLLLRPPPKIALGLAFVYLNEIGVSFENLGHSIPPPYIRP